MVSDAFTVAIGAGLIAALINTVGIYIINKFANWGKKNVIYFMSFAAGVLIAVSFMNLIPESFEMNPQAPIFLLVGFLSLYLFNRFLKVFVCHKKGCKDYAFGLVPALGVAFHSFLDGIIYSVTFSVSIFTGTLAVIGMILHEVPEGIVVFLLLVKSGFSKKKSSIYAFWAAAVTTPLGVLVSWPFINNLTEPVLGILLALSAGALVYIGATHLLPEIEEQSGRYSFLALFAGIAVAVVIMLVHG